MTRDDLIRRAVARALNPKVLDLAGMKQKVLGVDDAIVRHVERAKWGEIVAAFCEAPELGRLIYRLKYAQERADIPTLLRAGRLLAEAMNGRRTPGGGVREPTPMFLKMCRQAFIEYVHDECPRCTEGRLWARDVTCHACGGVGRVPMTVSEIENMESMRASDGKRAARVARLADMTAFHRRCPTCSGSGRVKPDPEAVAAALVTCGMCRGTLERRLTDHQRARQLGLSIEVFTAKSWHQRYEDAIDLLKKEDDAVASTVDSGLRRGRVVDTKLPVAHAVAAQSGVRAVGSSPEK